MTDQRLQDLIQAIDGADSSDGVLDAVEALADARIEGAISKLIEVLGYNNPGAAVAAVDGLIALGEPAVLPLLEQLDGYNYGARAWAIRALAGIGDPRALEILVTAASDFSLSVRRAAARGLGIIRWGEMESDLVPAALTQALYTLLQTCQDPEWVVRYAAVVGLQSLAIVIASEDPEGLETLRSQLEQMRATDPEPAISARISMAIARLPQLSRT